MEFLLDGDRVKIRQSFSSPTIYFDHWALCEFSDNPDLQNKLIEIISKKKGTFIISQINLVEFSKMDDPKHAKSAEIFLDRLMPNVYMADFSSLDQIVEFELKKLKKSISLPPDLITLKILGDRCIALSSKLSFDGFINLSYLNRFSLREILHKTAEEIADSFIKYKADQTFVKKSLQSRPDLERPKTYVIMGELMRDITINTNQSIKINDVIDLQHAILPICYCDYVLLDGAWEQRVKNMHNRIAKQNINLKTAKCFSKKNNGIHNFLADLDNFENSSQSFS